MARKKPKPPSPWPTDPPLEPLQTTLARVGRPLLKHRFWSEGDARENFQKFAASGCTDFSRFTIGTADQLAEAYFNAEKAQWLVREMAEQIEKHAKPSVRAHAAAANILAGAQMVDAAVFMHMRDSQFYVNSTLILLRTALELVGKGGFIALGTGNEASRWEHGPKLPERKARLAAELKAKECLVAIDAHVQLRGPGTDRPYVVYEWLCRFTHFDIEAFEHPADHEDAYATLAYVAWLAAVMAEVVLGISDLAVWPTAWPKKLPWS